MADADKISLPWPRDQERIHLADGCAKSSWLFAKYAVGLGINPEGYWLTERVHKPVLDWLQTKYLKWVKTRKGKNRKRLRILLVLFRTWGKTMLVTKSFSIWTHLHDRDLASIIDSISKSRSEEFLISLRNTMDGTDPYALFVYMYGNWKRGNRRWTASKGLDTAFRKTMSKSEPSFGTSSVETGIVGLHPDLLLMDDLVSDEKLSEWGDAWLKSCDKHTGSVIPAVKSNGVIIMVGTPYHDKDPIAKAMRMEGVCENAGMKIDDARVKVDPEKGQWHVYWLPAEDENGKSIMPEVWPEEELDIIRRTRPKLYAAQYRLRPGSADLTGFSERDVERLWVPTSKLPERVVAQIAIDTAFRKPGQKEGGDWNVIQTWLHARDGSGMVFFRGARGNPNWNELQVANQLIDEVENVRSHGFMIAIITDEDFGSRMTGLWARFLKNAFVARGVKMPRVHFIPRGGSGQGRKNKLTRMRDALTYWSSGYVRLIEGAPLAHHLIDQAINFSRRANDDFADAAADVFNEEVYRPARYPIAEGDRGTFPFLRAEDRVLKGPIVDERVVEALRKIDERAERARFGPEIIGVLDDEEGELEGFAEGGW